jgi:hypothetical protein
MPQRADKTETGANQVRLPAGVALKPPVTLEDLKRDTEYDPEGAEKFVALIRALRNLRLPLCGAMVNTSKVLIFLSADGSPRMIRW